MTKEMNCNNIQVSPRWADVPLPPEFISHAVLDVYAVAEVHQRLLGLEVAQPITAKTPGGTPVALLASDGAEVAHGIISLERPQALDGINLTATRAVMTISKIIVPSFLLHASLCQSKHSVSLASLGPPPISIVCNTRNLRVCLRHHHQMMPQIPGQEFVPVRPPTFHQPSTLIRLLRSLFFKKTALMDCFQMVLMTSWLSKRLWTTMTGQSLSSHWRDLLVILMQS